MEIIMMVMTYAPQVLEALLLIMGGAAALATLTPNKTDDEVIQKVLNFINMLACNFGKSKNK